MRIEVLKDGKACLDCIHMIANGETVSDMHADELEAVVEGTAGWSSDSRDDDGEFGVLPCVCCGDHLAGDRYQVALLGEVKL